MKKYFLYAYFVLVHKMWVARYAWTEGVLWRGLLHDLSKFTPTEFKAHADYFFGGGSPHEDWCLTCKNRRINLDKAWLHHLRRNPHHPEYHVVVQAGEGTDAPHVRTREFRYVVMEMPEVYRREMWVDWLSRALHRDGNNLKDWYKEVGRHHPMGPETRTWVEEKLKRL